MKKIIITTLLVLLPVLSWAGGGWILKVGEGFFKASQSIIRADRFYNPNGDKITITTVSLYTTSFYGEYGISPKFTAVAYVPVFVRSTLNDVRFRQSGDVIPGDELNALGDIEIGLKYGLLQQGPIAVSLGLYLGLPVGEDQGGDGQILQTGDGEFNQKLQVEASHSFPNAPLYVTALAGFNNRTNNFSDELHLGLELGYVGEHFSGILKLKNVSSFNNGDADGGAGNTIFANNTEYLTLTPELNYNVGKHWGVSGSAGFALSGKNVLASPNYALGVYIAIQ